MGSQRISGSGRHDGYISSFTHYGRHVRPWKCRRHMALVMDACTQ